MPYTATDLCDAHVVVLTRPVFCCETYPLCDDEWPVRSGSTGSRRPNPAVDRTILPSPKRPLRILRQRGKSATSMADSSRRRALRNVLFVAISQVCARSL